MKKVTNVLFSLKEATASFASQGFVTKCFLIFIVDKVKNFAANNLLQVGELVTYWDLCNKKDGVHILKSSKVLKRQKVSDVSSSMGIVESRDKGFVLDLKLLFTIVDCFSGRFPPRFFYCETSLFHRFSWVIISCLIYFSTAFFIDMKIGRAHV